MTKIPVDPVTIRKIERERSKNLLEGYGGEALGYRLRRLAAQEAYDDRIQGHACTGDKIGSRALFDVAFCHVILILVKSIRLLVLFAVCLSASAQTVLRSPEIPKFMGREVVLYEPADKGEGTGASPEEPAKVCLEGPPREQCYTTPKEFGFHPTVELVELSKKKSALFFSAASGGVSGWGVHLALLVPGKGKDLEDLLPSDVRISNQSQTAFWSEPELSDTTIFVTATFIWGPGESHYEEHRYEISAYVWLKDDYWQADQYVTSRWYSLDANADVLGSERAEVLSRLKKVLPGIRQRAQ